MRAKLIKRHNGEFYLRHPGGEITSHHELSIKNCEAIANGYDLDGLADEVFEKRPKEIPYVDEYDFKQGVVAGFQKALELLGDKKFSEVDVKKAYMIGWNSCSNFNGNDESQEFIESPGCIQSLQQTEWDCIIEMECCGNYNPPCNINCGYGPKPKLDTDGCLILKRI